MQRATNIVRSLLPAAALLLVGAGPLAAATNDTIEDPRYLVEQLPPTAPCCPATLAFRVTDKAAGGVRELALSARVETVRDFFFGYGSKLVIEGELRYGGSILLIADLETGGLEDKIWNYGHAFSPSGRFLVYLSHYPRMIVPEARRSIVMLYDLAISPADNRFGVDPRDPQRGIGLPVFPAANAERMSFDVSLAGDRMYVSPFLWAEDERAFLFIECEPAWASCHLVEVGVDEGVTRGEKAPSIARMELDLHPYTRSEGAGPYTGGPDDPVRIAVERLEWKVDGSAVVVYPQDASAMVHRFELPRPAP